MNELHTCPVCGERATHVVEPREIKIGRWAATVDDEFMRCEACGEGFYLPGQMQASQARASRLIREQHGLLAPERIRALRAKYGLTQGQLERLMRVGPKTVARWEGGSVVPSAAANSLLLVLESVPAAMAELSLRAGVVPSKECLGDAYTLALPISWHLAVGPCAPVTPVNVSAMVWSKFKCAQVLPAQELQEAVA